MAEVYLELIGGRQPDFALANEAKAQPGDTGPWRPGKRPQPLPPRITDAETKAHAAFVGSMGDVAIWKKFS